MLLCDISLLYMQTFIIGVVVSSGQFGLTKPGDQVYVNVSLLQAPHNIVVANYLNDVNTTVTAGIAIIDGYHLCFNIATDIRDSVSTILPVEPVCGQCGKYG